MTYDAASRKVIVFGGFDGTTYLNDTWTFDGISWTQVAVSPSPPVRANAQMAMILSRTKSCSSAGTMEQIISATPGFGMEQGRGGRPSELYIGRGLLPVQCFFLTRMGASIFLADSMGISTNLRCGNGTGPIGLSCFQRWFLMRALQRRLRRIILPTK